MTAPDAPPAAARAACASRPARSRGRLHAEPESPTRSPFQRDRDRVVHCGAFRRLQYKTQVFVYHEGDYYRTRLTHSIEVAQIARSICRRLGLDEDLAEALALAHDLGHTPFGHAGEDALDAALRPTGGFDHNEQTLRIVTRLERRYAAFDGLNLTWETLEGLAKHNGPLVGGRAPPGGPAPSPTLAALDRELDLELATFAGPEAQVAALADDIAYDNHDVDDGLRAGLFTVDDLHALPLVGPAFAEVDERHPGLEASRRNHEGVRRIIDAMIGDLVAETGRRLAELAPADAEAVRRAGAPVVAFSERMRENERALRDFLFLRMYRHDRVNRMAADMRRVVRELFEGYTADSGRMPAEWRAQAEGLDAAGRARVVADYIAGMTDRFALQAHDQIAATYAEHK